MIVDKMIWIPFRMKLLFIYLLVFNLKELIAQRYPACTSNYIQIFSGNNGLEGRIYVPISIARATNQVEVIVSFTITGNIYTQSSGTFGLLYDKETVLEQIKSGTRKPLLYRLIFPVQNPSPIFHDIIVNGQVYCRNPEVPIRTSSKTFTLNHSLRYHIQGLTMEPDVIRPDPTFPRPDTTFSRPDTTFSNPDTTFSRPDTTFSRPDTTFSRPDTTFSRPDPTFPRPDTTFSRPDTTFSRPNVERPFVRPTEEVYVPPEPTRPPPPIPRPTTTVTSRPVTSNQDICGTIQPTSLIAGGEDFEHGDWPWLTAIFHRSKSAQHFICGGSLISKRFVVTAAHCINSKGTSIPPSDMTVLLGKHELLDFQEEFSQSRKIIRYHIHNEYNFTTFNADIALLQLNRDVEFSRFVRPICIWKVDNTLSTIVTKTGLIAGWGKDENGVTLARPKRIVVPIVSREDCIKDQPEIETYINDKSFCAGYRNGSSPCKGDSGGGLALKLSNRWVLRGIVSFSPNSDFGECNSYQYVVFCDAAKFTSWILERI